MAHRQAQRRGDIHHQAKPIAGRAPWPAFLQWDIERAALVHGGAQRRRQQIGSNQPMHEQRRIGRRADQQAMKDPARMIGPRIAQRACVKVDCVARDARSLDPERRQHQRLQRRVDIGVHRLPDQAADQKIAGVRIGPALSGVE
jgi:hypothetical protein